MSGAHESGPFADPREVTAHRPWELPPAAWIGRMRWTSLLFAHWPVAAASLRDRVPRGLEIDLFDGSAWVGVIPFVMSHTNLRVFPVATDFRFLELNVRTYVTTGGKPGVFFFSLDASSRLATIGARAAYGLPYFDARMAISARDGSVDYASDRTDRRGAEAHFRAAWAPAGAAFHPQPGSLAHFLTERYCLYAFQERSNTLRRVDVHHRPWSLRPATASIDANTYARANGIALPDTPPLLHASALLDVVFQLPRRIAPS